MTSLELIRSKQRVIKATEDHAEAVKQKLDDEDTAKFAPLKKIYEEVKNLPSCYRNTYSNRTPLPPTLEGMWEQEVTAHRISFWDTMGEYGWNLLIERGEFTQNTYRRAGSRTTKDAEVAKGWLIEKLATLLLDEKAN